MNVLSLFDGISCGQVALKQLNITIDNYFASEIDKFAIKVTQQKHPKTIKCGDITKINPKILPKIDLVMGGSPCQGFSLSGKQLNFNDPRSRLFFEFVRILRDIDPPYWLLENVVMKQEYQDIISSYLGVQPVKLNSTNTSAQNRVRLYWANFEITEPINKGIKLKDILEPDNKMLNKASILGRRLNNRGVRDDYNKNIAITQCLEVRASNRDKSNCLTTVSKDTVLTTLPIGRHPDVYKNKLFYQNYTKIERCRLMNLPDDYCNDLSYNQTVKTTGNGWDVDMIKHILKYLEK